MSNRTLESRTTARLELLEQQARLLEPGSEQRHDWLQQLQQYTDDFLDALPTKKVFNVDPTLGAGILDLDIPEEGRALEILLEKLAAHVDNQSLDPASGHHMGYIPGGGVYTSAVGDYLAALTNRYVGMFFPNPGAVRIEHQLIRWMAEMIGFPATASGNLSSGGSIANLTAIVTARDYHKIKGDRISKAVIYLTRQTHHCVMKAYRIAGLEDAILRYIPMDEQFRMDAGALAQTLAEDKARGLIPFMIVGSGGTTDTGAVDPLDQMAGLADTYGCWFHIDAAYGGFFMLVDSLRPEFKGMERADSVVIDPHKGLFLAYGIGALIVRDAQALFAANHYTANYLQDAADTNAELSPADLSPELTKHYRSLRMWISLQLLGVTPFRAALEEKRLLCLYFYDKIRELGFEVGPYPQLSVMIFRYPADDPNTFNAQLVQAVKQDGRVFLSSTTIDGVFWIRMAVLSFRTHRQEVDTCLKVLKELVESLLEAGS